MSRSSWLMLGAGGIFFVAVSALIAREFDVQKFVNSGFSRVVGSVLVLADQVGYLDSASSPGMLISANDEQEKFQDPETGTLTTSQIATRLEALERAYGLFTGSISMEPGSPAGRQIRQAKVTGSDGMTWEGLWSDVTAQLVNAQSALGQWLESEHTESPLASRWNAEQGSFGNGDQMPMRIRSKAGRLMPAVQGEYSSENYEVVSPNIKPRNNLWYLNRSRRAATSRRDSDETIFNAWPLVSHLMPGGNGGTASTPEPEFPGRSIVYAISPSGHVIGMRMQALHSVSQWDERQGYMLPQRRPIVLSASNRLTEDVGQGVFEGNSAVLAERFRSEIFAGVNLQTRSNSDQNLSSRISYGNAVNATLFAADLGRVDDVTEGLRIWDRLRHSGAVDASTLEPRMVPVETREGRVQLHVRIGPLRDAAGVAQICAHLRDRVLSCSLAEFSGENMISWRGAGLE